MRIRRGKVLSIWLALLITWAAIVVFSPIHKHDLRSPAKCSLNHLDAQQAEGAVAVIVIQAPDYNGLHDIADGTEARSQAKIVALPARAPPAFS